MYGNYTLYAYDSKFNCEQEWSFENVAIQWGDNAVSVLNARGKVLYAISTNCCTVVVMEDDTEEVR